VEEAGDAVGVGGSCGGEGGGESGPPGADEGGVDVFTAAHGREVEEQARERALIESGAIGGELVVRVGELANAADEGPPEVAKVGEHGRERGLHFGSAEVEEPLSLARGERLGDSPGHLVVDGRGRRRVGVGTEVAGGGDEEGERGHVRGRS
jgi:hypothetical protein